MPKTKRFTEGQEVFVVHQRSRYEERHDAPNRTELRKIVKVGRKYGYLNARHEPAPFDLETGCSHHPGDWNTRANGHGFDVYESEEAYEFEKLMRMERERLRVRLFPRNALSMIHLPHGAVEAIHKILDEYEMEPVL